MLFARELSEHASSLALLRFQKVAWTTIVAVYILILVGASVRASGSGMGCPDWPTCFGQWIPPTSESALPRNYQEVYADLGYAETRFNVVKTWTEYLNRLLGVSIGVLIFFTSVCAFAIRGYNPKIFYAAGLAFLLVGFQGWLGSKVVSSNLMPGLITVHMLVALTIVGTLIYALAQSRRDFMLGQPIDQIDPRFERWLYIVIVLTVVQVAMGTQVREMTDFISLEQGEGARSQWIDAMPWFFYVHRSFSAVLLFCNLWLTYLLASSLGRSHSLVRMAIAMVVIIFGSVISGATLGHLGMPAFIQPTHLLSASLLFGIQFLIWISYRQSRNSNVVPMSVAT
ncbi:MAG: heme A synthase [Deltaproteobacteria bacterium]|jgi:cytochrome c oxidase assembly protein subunit 15|nr:heme A synthase [Deltaproteobacteria bacterium]|tara:strand:- start:41 stop:1063 length:1023 start_codon:yes stop_codon:yes gene_type:complete